LAAVISFRRGLVENAATACLAGFYMRNHASDAQA
jgi:hypothetical protein